MWPIIVDGVEWNIFDKQEDIKIHWPLITVD